MAIDDLMRDPANESRDGWFSKSGLNLPAAAEYATGEVLVAGACRALVLRFGETEIDLDDIRTLAERLVRGGSTVPERVWSDMFTGDGGIRSPPVQGQSRSRILPQLCPLVPELAFHAGVLGRPRNRWNPGNLIIGSFAAGGDAASVRNALVAVRAALLVTPTDDFLARFVEAEMQAVSPQRRGTEEEVLGDAANSIAIAPRRAGPFRASTPAEQALQDLPRVIALKSRLTRRQWIAMFEGFLRFTLGSHLLWLCRLDQRAWALALKALDDVPIPSVAEITRLCYQDHLASLPALHLGQSAFPLFRVHIEHLVVARFGFSLLEQAVPALPPMRPDDQEIADFPALLHSHLVWLRAHRADFALEGLAPGAWARSKLASLLDKHPKYAAGAKGTFGNNLFEYLRHTLGQIQPIEDADSEYDQSYVLRKASRATSAPWHVQPGPALQMLWVHLCCGAAGGAASLRDLANYLRNYGITLPDVQASRQAPMRLEQLGLVIDSPDAAGGRMLVDPFPRTR